MNGFTKLWSEILSSSIWNEDDKVRITWITLLAAMPPDYIVRASVGGLAHMARLTKEDCERALRVLESPDEDSRSKEFDGRRLRRVDGGFLILNAGKYREARSQDERKAYMAEYMKEYRKQSVNIRKQNVNSVNLGKPPLAQAEAEAEAEKNNKKKTMDVPVPASLSIIPEFSETWKEFIRFRVKKGFAVSKGSVGETLRTLEQRPDTALDALKLILEKGWRGFDWSWYDNVRGERRQSKTATEHQPPVRLLTTEELQKFEDDKIAKHLADHERKMAEGQERQRLRKEQERLENLKRNPTDDENDETID